MRDNSYNHFWGKFKEGIPTVSGSLVLPAVCQVQFNRWRPAAAPSAPLGGWQFRDLANQDNVWEVVDAIPNADCEGRPGGEFKALPPTDPSVSLTDDVIFGVPGTTVASDDKIELNSSAVDNLKFRGPAPERSIGFPISTDGAGTVDRRLIVNQDGKKIDFTRPENYNRYFTYMLRMKVDPAGNTAKAIVSIGDAAGSAGKAVLQIGMAGTGILKAVIHSQGGAGDKTCPVNLADKGWVIVFIQAYVGPFGFLGNRPFIHKFMVYSQQNGARLWYSSNQRVAGGEPYSLIYPKVYLGYGEMSGGVNAAFSPNDFVTGVNLAEFAVINRALSDYEMDLVASSGKADVLYKSGFNNQPVRRIQQMMDARTTYPSINRIGDLSRPAPGNLAPFNDNNTPIYGRGRSLYHQTSVGGELIANPGLTEARLGQRIAYPEMLPLRLFSGSFITKPVSAAPNATTLRQMSGDPFLRDVHHTSIDKRIWIESAEVPGAADKTTQLFNWAKQSSPLSISQDYDILGGAITPFDESNLPSDATTINQPAVAGDVYPGLQQRLGDHIAIVIDLDPDEDTRLGVTQGGNIASMAYFNFSTKRWDIMGYMPGVSGSNASAEVAFSTARESSNQGKGIRLFGGVNAGVTGGHEQLIEDYTNLFRSASIGFIGTNGFTVYPDEGQNALSALSMQGRPTSTYGFPADEKYSSTTGQTLSIGDYIDAPFLLERFALKFDADLEESGPYSLGRMLPTVGRQPEYGKMGFYRGGELAYQGGSAHWAVNPSKNFAASMPRIRFPGTRSSTGYTQTGGGTLAGWYGIGDQFVCEGRFIGSHSVAMLQNNMHHPDGDQYAGGGINRIYEMWSGGLLSHPIKIDSGVFLNVGTDPIRNPEDPNKSLWANPFQQSNWPNNMTSRLCNVSSTYPGAYAGSAQPWTQAFYIPMLGGGHNGIVTGSNLNYSTGDGGRGPYLACHETYSTYALDRTGNIGQGNTWNKDLKKDNGHPFWRADTFFLLRERPSSEQERNSTPEFYSDIQLMADQPIIAVTTASFVNGTTVSSDSYMGRPRSLTAVGPWTSSFGFAIQPRMMAERFGPFAVDLGARYPIVISPKIGATVRELITYAQIVHYGYTVAPMGLRNHITSYKSNAMKTNPGSGGAVYLSASADPEFADVITNGSDEPLPVELFSQAIKIANNSQGIDAKWVSTGVPLFQGGGTAGNAPQKLGVIGTIAAQLGGGTATNGNKAAAQTLYGAWKKPGEGYRDPHSYVQSGSGGFIFQKSPAQNRIMSDYPDTPDSVAQLGIYDYTINNPGGALDKPGHPFGTEVAYGSHQGAAGMLDTFHVPYPTNADGYWGQKAGNLGMNPAVLGSGGSIITAPGIMASKGKHIDFEQMGSFDAPGQPLNPLWYNDRIYQFTGSLDVGQQLAREGKLDPVIISLLLAPTGAVVDKTAGLPNWLEAGLGRDLNIEVTRGMRHNGGIVFDSQAMIANYPPSGDTDFGFRYFADKNPDHVVDKNCGFTLMTASVCDRPLAAGPGRESAAMPLRANVFARRMLNSGQFEVVAPVRNTPATNFDLPSQWCLTVPGGRRNAVRHSGGDPRIESFVTYPIDRGESNPWATVLEPGGFWYNGPGSKWDFGPYPQARGPNRYGGHHPAGPGMEKRFHFRVMGNLRGIGFKPGPAFDGMPDNRYFVKGVIGSNQRKDTWIQTPINYGVQLWSSESSGGMWGDWSPYYFGIGAASMNASGLPHAVPMPASSSIVGSTFDRYMRDGDGAYGSGGCLYDWLNLQLAPDKYAVLPSFFATKTSPYPSEVSLNQLQWPVKGQQESLYLLQPGDKLVLGCQPSLPGWNASKMPTNRNVSKYGIWDETASNRHQRSCFHANQYSPPQLKSIAEGKWEAVGSGSLNRNSQNLEHPYEAAHGLTLKKGKAKLILYGTLLRNNKHLPSELNQPLRSDAIHEALHYNNPVMDQFQIERESAYKGSYISELVRGNILGTDLSTPPLSNTRGVVTGPAGTGGPKPQGNCGNYEYATQRFVRISEESQVFWDSLLPNPVGIALKQGGFYNTSSISHTGFSIAKKPSYAFAFNLMPEVVPGFVNFFSQDRYWRHIGNVDWQNSFPFEAKFAGVSRMLTRDASMGTSGIGGYKRPVVPFINPVSPMNSGSLTYFIDESTLQSRAWWLPDYKNSSPADVYDAPAIDFTTGGTWSGDGATYRNQSTAYVAGKDYWLSNTRMRGPWGTLTTDGNLSFIFYNKNGAYPAVDAPISAGTPKLLTNVWTIENMADGISTDLNMGPSSPTNWADGEPAVSARKLSDQQYRVNAAIFAGYGRANKKQLDVVRMNGGGIYSSAELCLAVDCGHPAGWKYGLMNCDHTSPSMVFRCDRYGQLRDMLEQRLYSKCYSKGDPFNRRGQTESAVTCIFVDADGNPVSDASKTTCFNISTVMSSSVPYKDGESGTARNLIFSDDSVVIA